MIIIVCKDDEKSLKKIADASIKNNAAVFGTVFTVFDSKIPQLKPNENLFLIAHGAFDDDSGNPVIGDQSKDFFVNGIELWGNIHELFPANYSANVYIDACESADHDNEVFSFIEVFYSQFNIENNGMVYGKNGASSGQIALPEDTVWVAANTSILSHSKNSSTMSTTDNNNQDKGAKNTPIQNNETPKISRFRRLKDFAAKKRIHNEAIAAAAAGGAAPVNYTTLTVPGPDPSNKEAVKYYAFNQTGNIMMSSTDLTSDSITQSVRDLFNEVSVFFAAMTKAISTTIDPVTHQPYSIYDYTALSNIISGSGLFIHVTEEDISYTSQAADAEVSKELIEGLLGLATGSGELAFAEGMIASMSSAGLSIQASKSSSDSKVANIIFVCEYLLGMPVVSAVVVYCDMSNSTQHVQVGPCFSETTTETSLLMHKDTYLFVTPKFIKEYAGDLLSVEQDGVYNEFIDYLSDLVLAKPDIVGVTVSNSSVQAPSALTPGMAYQINGECFGTTPGTLKLGSTSLPVGTWNSNYITFTAPTTAISTPAMITLFMPGNSGSTADASSPSPYSVA